MERVTDEEAGEGGWFWNEQVGSYRPPGALYCRECGVSMCAMAQNEIKTRESSNLNLGISNLYFSCLLRTPTQVLIQDYDHL